MVRRTADDDGRVHVLGRGQQQVPGLPGADAAARSPARAGRSSSRPSHVGDRATVTGDPADACSPSAPRRPRRRADAGPRYTPVELARLLRLHAAHPGAGRDHRRAGRAAAGGRRRRLGQDRDDGRAGGLAGRQRVRPPGADPRPHLHPQGRRRAGPPGAHPARPARCRPARPRRRCSPASRPSRPTTRTPPGWSPSTACGPGTSRPPGCSPRRPAGSSPTRWCARTTAT